MWKPKWGNSLACSKLMLVSWSTLMYGYLGKIYPADFDTQTYLPRRCSRYVVKGSKQRPSWRQNLLSSSTFYSWAPANIFRLLCRAMLEIRISNNIAITVQIFSDAFFDDVHFEHVTIALSFYSSKNHFGQFPNVLDHLIFLYKMFWTWFKRWNS